jgi:transforming growth factor-beta-induced protein
VVHAIDKVLIPEVVLDVVDPTIFGLAMMTPSLSTLVEALEITGLDAAVDDRNAELTVFAPTNDAFDTFLNGASLNDVDVNELTSLILNHVVAGVNLSTDLTTGYVNTEAESFGGKLSMFVNTDGGVVLNAESTVTAPDNLAANGVVHVVNAVISFPTPATYVVADPNFSTLLEALSRPGLFNYIGVLTGQGPNTVFAPTNQAFEDLLVELGANSLDDVDTATLEAVLDMHVIPNFNVRAEDLQSGPVSTLGEDIIIDAANATITDPNGRVSNIIVINVQAANGVVHAIDKVILPQL